MATQSQSEKTEQEASPKKLSVWKKLLFLAFILTSTIGLVELVLQMGLADTEIRLNPKVGGLVVPYRPGSEADLVAAEFRVRYRINRLGFRDRPTRQLENPEKTPRVALFGDSFTEGYGVQFDDTYGQCLERKMPEIEFWNLARMGSSPMFYVIQARYWLKKVNPDVIVIQLFDNDLKENQYRGLKLGADGKIQALPEELKPGSMFVPNLRDFAIVEGIKRFSRYTRGKSLPRLFVRPGAKVSAASLALPKHMTSDDKFYDFHKAKDISPWKEHLDRQALLLEQFLTEAHDLCPKSKIVVLYVPHVSSFAQVRSGRSMTADNPHAKVVIEVCEKLKGKMPVQFVHSGEALLNPDKVPEDYYYKQDLHWNREGHKAIADFLAPIMKKSLNVN